MANCCPKKPQITDLARSQRLTRRATREAKAAASGVKGAKGVLVKPNVKKPRVKPIKPCCT